MMTAQEKQILDEYGELMNEAKIRLSHAIILIHEPPSDHPLGIVKECVFLQFRMICELIALGCLLAHSGIKGAQTKRMKKEHAADRIVDELEKLHPHFFPHAIIPTVDATGLLTGISEAPDGYLTKKELIRLNGLCGSVLHRGNIEHYRSGKPAPNSNKTEAEMWANKIRGLLENHMMVMSGMDKVVACFMRLAEDGQPVATLFCEAR